MTQRSTLDTLKDTAVAETAADGSEIVSVDTEALSDHISTHEIGEAAVSTEDDPLFQEMFAELEADLEDGAISELFDDVPAKKS